MPHPELGSFIPKPFKDFASFATKKLDKATKGDFHSPEWASLHTIGSCIIREDEKNGIIRSERARNILIESISRLKWHYFPAGNIHFPVRFVFVPEEIGDFNIRVVKELKDRPAEKFSMDHLDLLPERLQNLEEELTTKHSTKKPVVYFKGYFDAIHTNRPNARKAIAMLEKRRRQGWRILLQRGKLRV